MTRMENGASQRKRFWVGGATGFLGSHLVRALVRAGHDVVAVSRGGGNVDGIPVAQVDVLDEDAVAESARGVDGAFLATGKVARDKDAAGELHRLHVEGTRSALAGLKQAGVQRVVVASTSGTIAVGTDPDRIYDESAQAPLEIIAPWPYYRSKLYAEREALAANQAGFEVIVVNPSLLLGPGDLRESSTADVRLFLQRSVPAIPAGGMAFVDVRDAAEGMRLAFERGRPGERYLLNGKNLSLAAFFARLERISGVKGPALPLPKSRPVALGIGRLYMRAVKAIGGQPPVDETTLEMGQYFWYCNSSKAERELGFSARDPGETLRDTVDDLVARHVVFLKRERVGEEAYST
ncbi:MAG: NAD-dependent epimerase/dehydratase family protein [Myxococcota bacterium]